MWQVCIPDVSSDKCTGSLGNSGQGRIVLRNIYQKAPLQYCRAVLLSTTSERRCLWRDCSLPSPYFPCLVQLIWKDTCLTHTVLIPPWPHFSPVWCGPSDAVGDGFCCSATVLSSHGPYWEFPDLLVIFQSVFFSYKMMKLMGKVLSRSGSCPWNTNLQCTQGKVLFPQPVLGCRVMSNNGQVDTLK